MAIIKIHGELAVAEIRSTNEDEGYRDWLCSCGAVAEREFETMADVINDAEDHIHHRCPQEGTA